MAGKTINELDERTILNGKENIPFQEEDTNGRLSTDALKRYVTPDLTPYQKTVDADKKYLSAVEIDDVTSIYYSYENKDINANERCIRGSGVGCAIAYHSVASARTLYCNALADADYNLFVGSFSIPFIEL